MESINSRIFGLFVAVASSATFFAWMWAVRAKGWDIPAILPIAMVLVAVYGVAMLVFGARLLGMNGEKPTGLGWAVMIFSFGAVWQVDRFTGGELWVGERISDAVRQFKGESSSDEADRSLRRDVKRAQDWSAELQRKRAELNTSNEEAVAAFNQEAKEYSEFNARVTADVQADRARTTALRDGLVGEWSYAYEVEEAGGRTYTVDAVAYYRKDGTVSTVADVNYGSGDKRIIEKSGLWRVEGNRFYLDMNATDRDEEEHQVWTILEVTPGEFRYRHPSGTELVKYRVPSTTHN